MKRSPSCRMQIGADLPADVPQRQDADLQRFEGVLIALVAFGVFDEARITSRSSIDQLQRQLERQLAVRSMRRPSTVADDAAERGRTWRFPFRVHRRRECGGDCCTYVNMAASRRFGKPLATAANCRRSRSPSVHELDLRQNLRRVVGDLLLPFVPGEPDLLDAPGASSSAWWWRRLQRTIDTSSSRAASQSGRSRPAPAGSWARLAISCSSAANGAAVAGVGGGDGRGRPAPARGRSPAAA